MSWRPPAEREHNDAERGRRLIKEAPPLGECLGRTGTGVYVFENSPQPLIDELMDEYRKTHGDE